MAEVTEEKIGKKPRPDVLPSVTIRWKTGCDKLYTVITYDDEGPVEVFTYLGLAGQCDNCMLEAVTRNITAGLRMGVPIQAYIKSMSSIQCPKPINFPREEQSLSCSDAVAQCLRKFQTEELWKQGYTMEDVLSGNYL